MSKAPQTTPEIVLKKVQTNFPKVQVKTSKEAEEFIRLFYSDDIGIYESFFILLLNRASKTVGFAKISQGGITGTVVDVKIVAKYVVDTMASGVILAHNHPSGTAHPSQADRDITRKIKEALKLLDSEVLDHIILTEDSYYSFADNGAI